MYECNYYLLLTCKSNSLDIFISTICGQGNNAFFQIFYTDSDMRETNRSMDNWMCSSNPRSEVLAMSAILIEKLIFVSCYYPFPMLMLG